MTDLPSHPSFLTLEDRLDLIGQRHRVYLLLRGAMHWLMLALIATLGVAVFAGFAGPGRLAAISLMAWVILLGWSAVSWFVRPLLFKPRPLDVARLIESRVDGLHNGLTNSLLLAHTSHPSQSLWTGAIFEEVARSVDGKPLQKAVPWTDLKPSAIRLGFAFLVAIVLMVSMPARLAHGWRQMLQPGAFVPTTGVFQILEVQPGDATLVAGQALDITATASGPQLSGGPPSARLFFDGAIPEASVSPVLDNGIFHYSYTVPHVDRSMRYRLDIGGTQSNWYTINTVPQIKLTQLNIKVTPPPYTHLDEQTIALTPANASDKPVTVPQGSGVEISVDIDVSASRAVLLVNNDDPVEMTSAQASQRYFIQTAVLHDSQVYVGIICNGQMVAKLPERGLTLHVVPDAPPSIAMHWPAREITTQPSTQLTIKATISDDYGISSSRLLVGAGSGDLAVVDASQQRLDTPVKSQDFEFALKLNPEESAVGKQVSVQVQATDNRDLTNLSKDLGPQSASGSVVIIHFADPSAEKDKEAKLTDQLQTLLEQMLQKQTELGALTTKLFPQTRPAELPEVNATQLSPLAAGQVELRSSMQDVAKTFAFDDHTRFAQKTLQLLAANPATDAVDLSNGLATELSPPQRLKQAITLAQKQKVIITTLQSLLARLQPLHDLSTRPAESADGHIPTSPDALKKLDEALKKYMAEQQRILNQSASLAKKPVADYDDQDKKKLDELKQAQDDLDAFMEEHLSDFSKNAEQDLSNASLLKDLMQVYSEVTMAADALKSKPVEMAVALEDEGLEGAKEIESNLERWLANTPDRTQWNQEDPLTANDAPLPELPSELQDMVGKLLEQQEDLDQQMEDQNANWADSIDKGVGWDAMDGPIADMSAKGVTGNVLPNNNEMQGRSGEGRSGKSEGEFVGDTAVGKGGRLTPTRLEPTPFEKGQIQDESKDPVGGATGGGKISGAGAAGLEGPVPPQQQQQMQRLSQMQASIRSNAERLNAQFAVGRYDNFKLMQSIAQMRRVETDLRSNRYQNALRGVDVAAQDMEASQMLVGGRIQVDQDTTATGNRRTDKDISDAAQGDLPPAFSEALKEYYRKLSER